MRIPQISNPFNKLTPKQKKTLRVLLITWSASAKQMQVRKSEDRVKFLEEVVRGNNLHHPNCRKDQVKNRSSLGLPGDCTCWAKR